MDLFGGACGNLLCVSVTSDLLVETDSDAMKSTTCNGLEMQRWMTWIDLEHCEISVRYGLSFIGQNVKALPKSF